MEFNSLLLSKDIDNVTRYLAQTSNNPDERQNFNSSLLTAKDVFNIEKIERIGSKSITSQIIKTEMQAIGIENIQNSEDDVLEYKSPQEWFAAYEDDDNEEENE